MNVGSNNWPLIFLFVSFSRSSMPFGKNISPIDPDYFSGEIASERSILSFFMTVFVSGFKGLESGFIGLTTTF